MDYKKYFQGHWSSLGNRKVNTTYFIYASICVFIKHLCCTYNTHLFCMIYVWWTSQTATRGSHWIKQSTIFTWCVTFYWFSIFVHAKLIFVVMTCVLSHEVACIFCFSSTIACLLTCNNKVIYMVTFFIWTQSRARVDKLFVANIVNNKVRWV